MRLRCLADHCISHAIIEALRGIGVEVVRLRDALPTNAPDEVVLAKAQELEALVVSLNGDFANIVTYPPSRYQGIIALQVHNHPEIIPQLMARPRPTCACIPPWTSIEASFSWLKCIAFGFGNKGSRASLLPQ